jgi:hypothetical protein
MAISMLQLLLIQVPTSPENSGRSGRKSPINSFDFVIQLLPIRTARFYHDVANFLEKYTDEVKLCVVVFVSFNVSVIIPLASSSCQDPSKPIVIVICVFHISTLSK